MPTNCEPCWGLAAIGTCGRISIDVDEATAGPERWQLTLDCPKWCLRFEISGPQVVANWLAFLEAHDGKQVFAEQPIGRFLSSQVVIRKDDEFPDRFFLCLGEDEITIFTLIAEEVQDLMTALRQAAEDLSRAA